MIINTNSSEDTIIAGAKFAQKLKGGEIFGLIGDLGLGKTTFCQGIAKGFGIKQNVNSPTFVIMKEYNITKANSPIKKMIHIDAYRLDSASSLDDIGLRDYFQRNDTLILIEWPEKIMENLPKKIKLIKFSQTNKDSRIIEITS